MRNAQPAGGDTQAEKMRKKGYELATVVADRVGITVQAVYKWLQDGVVRGVRIGTRRYVERASVVEYFKRVDPRSVALLELDK